MLNSTDKEKVIKRLNRISGQVEGIKRMVSEPRYCIDILIQISSVRSALDSVSRFILEDHLKTCVANALRRGQGKIEIKELVDIFNRVK